MILTNFEINVNLIKKNKQLSYYVLFKILYKSTRHWDKINTACVYVFLAWLMMQYYDNVRTKRQVRRVTPGFGKLNLQNILKHLFIWELIAP